MKELSESLQYKLRNSPTDIFEVAELKRRGVISEEICEVFENAERIHGKRNRKGNVLKWWLGWSNHRQLFKVLRETRRDLHKSKVTPSATTEIQDFADGDFYEELDGNMSKIDDVLDADDLKELRLAQEAVLFGGGVQDEDFNYHDFLKDLGHYEDVADGDYNEEFCFTKEQAEIKLLPGDVDQVPLDAGENDEEQTLIDFAKNQMERMKQIREQLLDMPNTIKCVSADQILTLPLSQRWMLFARWKRAYQEIIDQDMRGTEKEYEDKIVEYNKLKGQSLAALCRTADIVGMTTTGAAKNRLLLESLKAKIGNKVSYGFSVTQLSLFARIIFCSDRGRSGSSPRVAHCMFLDSRLPTVDYDRGSSTTTPVCECQRIGHEVSTRRITIRTLNYGWHGSRSAGCSASHAARSSETDCPCNLFPIGEP